MEESGSGVAPYLAAPYAIVLFDGECKLCDALSRFIIRHDGALRMRLCPLQSDTGQALLRHFGLPTDDMDTVVVVEGGRAHVRSDAILTVLRRLPLPWRLGALGRVVPRPLRDWLYGHVARNRYRLFGKYDTCLMPTPEVMEHFLQEPATP